MRLRPEQHLRRQGDIRAVRELGSRLDCRSFTLWWRIRDPLEASGVSSRVAVIASIASVGAAVPRNRAKRRLREIFRSHQSLLPAGSDLLLVARAAVNRRSFAELENNFTEACGRIRSVV